MNETAMQRGIMSQQVNPFFTSNRFEFQMKPPGGASARQSLIEAPKSELEQKKDYLQSLGLKVKDFGKHNMHRLYTELTEYQASGKLPSYLTE